jgi:hypothetical protein
MARSHITLPGRVMFRPFTGPGGVMQFISTRVLRRVRKLARYFHHRIDNWLIDLAMLEQPGALQRAALRVLMGVRLRLLYFLYGQHGMVEIWQGEETASGMPLRVLYIGAERAYEANSPEYLRFILYKADTAQVQPRGRAAMRRAHLLAQELAPTVDLVIIDRSPVQRWVPASGDWLVTPTFVRMAFDINPGQTWEEIERCMRKQKHNLSLIRRHGYTARVSNQQADFDFFYERMHVPMMHTRHADYGVIEGKRGLEEQFHRGHVILVDRPGEGTVAGAVNTLYGKWMFGIVSGTLDGDRRWHEQGALSALYYHTLRWCFDNGIRRFDNGFCRPFQTDGAYQHKRYWGMTVVPDPWPLRDWLLWVPQGSPTALAWIQAHPLIPGKHIRGTLVSTQAVSGRPHTEAGSAL